LETRISDDQRVETKGAHKDDKKNTTHKQEKKDDKKIHLSLQSNQNRKK
jgi:hypothetical protein